VSTTWYWGDLHNHCGISYGHGSLERALAVARQQLDFCAVTGHAFWPDMPDGPADRERLGPIREYHQAGFARLRDGWSEVQRQMAAANTPGRFVTFPSYEWHSNADGDHHILYAGDDAPLVGGARIGDLKDALRTAAETGAAPPALVVPHHIGYPAGSRGINWETFSETLSPFVEIVSMHGCAESDEAPAPYLRRMGPRDGHSVASWGLRLGHRVGLVGSTDHHAAYPGSYGSGRLAAAATALTREALWEAFLARRVYAATGDRIGLDFTLDGHPMGAEAAAPGRRHLELRVQGRAPLQAVQVLKNERPLRAWGPPDLPDAHPAADGGAPLRALVRLEWGWSDAAAFPWDCRLKVQDGTLLDVETCFAGPPISAPVASYEEEETLPHVLLARDAASCAWRSRTAPSPTERHSGNQSLIAEVEMPTGAVLAWEVNGQRFAHTLSDLLDASRAHVLRGWRSEAVLFHRALPVAAARLEAAFDDAPGEGEVDVYRLRVAQQNGQWAWSSPVWAHR
jgi:hypothetical protein